MSTDGLNLPDLAPNGAEMLAALDEAPTAAKLAPVFDVPVHIRAVLGKSQLDVAQLRDWSTTGWSRGGSWSSSTTGSA